MTEVVPPGPSAPGAAPALHFEILTLFPELFDSFLGASLIGKAIETGIVAVTRTNLREFGLGRHRAVDDSARRLATMGRVLLICGRYEGFDERIATLHADEVLSIGDYVLCGGELGAAVVIEAASRLCPGVIGKSESTVEESFSAGRLEYPQYTRPPEYRGLAVPEILLGGDHAAIAAWRAEQSLARTRATRPDLLDRHPLTAQEHAQEQKRLREGPAPDKGGGTGGGT
jgi:tRNA (guanine37-N1)-methyltransferase